MLATMSCFACAVKKNLSLDALPNTTNDLCEIETLILSANPVPLSTVAPLKKNKKKFSRKGLYRKCASFHVKHFAVLDYLHLSTHYDARHL